MSGSGAEVVRRRYLSTLVRTYRQGRSPQSLEIWLRA